MTQQSAQPKAAYYSSLVIAGVLVLLPFHALFTTWIGSNTDHIDLVRIWKELIIVGLIPASIYLLYGDKRLKAWFRSDWLPKLILLYMAVSVLLGVWAFITHRVNSTALIYGLLANLRFPGFFLITFIASAKNDLLKRHWKKLVLVPLAAVVSFGLVQRLVLPYDFLRHFGYGPDTIPAYQTVDNKIDYRRIQSTLRGANPLGAYLVLALPAILVIRRRSHRLALLPAALLALLFTYSRSAWIGAVAAAAAYLYIAIKSTKSRRLLMSLLAVAVVFAGLAIWALRHNSVAQNTFFHTDNSSRSAVSSNSGRAAAIENGLSDIGREPLGRGVGTAGPASVRNDGRARIAENYYLQIGQETGLIGLGMFLAIIWLVGQALWRQRSDELSRVLLAALAGLSVVNLVSHAWADDTLGLLWWGLAGICLAGIIKNKHHDVSPKKKTTARS